MPEEIFDYIVIGAGSAGSAVAGRLAERGHATILVLEAGGRAGWPWGTMPAGIEHLLADPSCQWGFETVPQRGLGGRCLALPQGRLVGGTSAINGMLYVRGHRLDYDDWAGAGCAGWRFADVLPYFIRAEGNREHADALHGTSGPLSVSAQRQVNAYSRMFIAAGTRAGLGFNPDFNGVAQDGIGLFQATIEDGKRCSAARAYLRRRPNLEVRTGSAVERIMIDGGRAGGVAYRRGARLHHVSARREIILSGGAFNSPRLLMLSGIGAAGALGRLGIVPLLDRPDVGRNLQDHVSVFAVAEVKESAGTYDGQDRGLAALRNGLRYFAHRSGPAASVGWEAGAFLHSAKGLDRPDIEMHFIPFGLDRPDTPRPGITFNVSNLRPFSRGSVMLASADPAQPPLIDPAWLTDERDLQPLRAGLEHARRIAGQSPLRERIGELHVPGEVDEYIRAHAGSDFHFGGTCRMGEDEDAVVDAQLRVRGIDGLRIADCSVMPRLVGGNTNAAAIMIGERCADFLQA